MYCRYRTSSTAAIFSRRTATAFAASSSTTTTSRSTSAPAPPFLSTARTTTHVRACRTSSRRSSWDRRSTSSLWRSPPPGMKLMLRLPVRCSVHRRTLSRIHRLAVLAQAQSRHRRLRRLPGWTLGLYVSPAVRRRSGFIATTIRWRPHMRRPRARRTMRRAGYGGTEFLAALWKRFANFWVGAFVRYDNLAGAAFVDSPLVRTRGVFRRRHRHILDLRRVAAAGRSQGLSGSCDTALFRALHTSTNTSPCISDSWFSACSASRGPLSQWSCWRCCRGPRAAVSADGHHPRLPHLRRRRWRLTRAYRFDLSALDALRDRAADDHRAQPSQPHRRGAGDLAAAGDLHHEGGPRARNLFLGAGARLADYIRNDSIRGMIDRSVAALRRGYPPARLSRGNPHVRARRSIRSPAASASSPGVPRFRCRRCSSTLIRRTSARAGRCSASPRCRSPTVSALDSVSIRRPGRRDFMRELETLFCRGARAAAR